MIPVETMYAPLYFGRDKPFPSENDWQNAF